ncbi:MAG: hypothetical protein MK106_08270 [Mariniblastus sp.]|nr:hypothetical protein [Mariniblastus sp.]
MKLSVQPVRSSKDWGIFFELRREIYRGDAGVVFPLKSIERSMLDTSVHPFYEHASRQAFLCYRGKRPVGRIVAIKDDLHNEYYQDRIGFFGYFESIDDLDVAQALTDTAGNWLRDQDCDRVRGPVNPSMKSDFGVLVEGFGITPSVMMSYSRPYYDQLVKGCGFEKVMDFYAYLMDQQSEEVLRGLAMQKSELNKSTQKIFDRYPELELRDCKKTGIEKALREINDLGNLVRQEGWGFVPLTESELVYMIKQVRRVIRPDMILTIYWADQLVGYCVSIPDVNTALHRTWGKSDWVRIPQFLYQLRRVERSRVIALGVDPEFRRRGVAPLLSIEMRRRGLADPRLVKWEFSWIAEENIKSIRVTQRTVPCYRYKTYRLYEKSL